MSTERTTTRGKAVIFSLFDEWRHSQEKAGKDTPSYRERQQYAELASVDIDSKQALMFSAFIGGMQAALALVDRLDSSDMAEDQTAATAES